MASVVPVPPVNAGIQVDLELLWEAFKAKRSCRLLQFYEIVAEYVLSEIYCKRLWVTELLEFEECLLKAAFAYVRSRKETTTGVQTIRSLKERMFGVYATYVLYYAQPNNYVSKIFVTSCDVEDMKQLIKDILVPGRHFDTVACLQKLIVDDAFSVVPFIKCYDPVCYRRHEVSHWELDVIDEEEKHSPLEAARSVMEHPFLKTMAYVQKEMEAKQQSYFKIVLGPENNFLAHLDNIYTTFKRKIEELEIGDVENSQMDASINKNGKRNSEVNNDGSANRSSIKYRAYASSVSYSRSRRYADPNMIENFPIVATNNEEIGVNEGIPSISAPKRKRRSVTKKSAIASHATDESITSDDHATENSTSPKRRPKSKVPRKNSKNRAEAVVEEDVTNKGIPSNSSHSKKSKSARRVSTTKSTTAAEDSAVPEHCSNRVSHSKNRTRVTAPRKERTKKMNGSTSSPSRAVEHFDSEKKSCATRNVTKTSKRPLRPHLDAEFEAKIRSMEALLEDHEDERVKMLLGS